MTQGAAGSTRRLSLTTISVIVGILVAGTGLVFEPSDRAFGRVSATSAPSSPAHRSSLRFAFGSTSGAWQNLSEEEAALEPNRLGAEVRFTYETEGFRGSDLPVTYSLVTVEP